MEKFKYIDTASGIYLIYCFLANVWGINLL